MDQVCLPRGSSASVVWAARRKSSEGGAIGPRHVRDVETYVHTYVLTCPITPVRLGLMDTKTSQLQIRVSPAEKAILKRLAAAEGISVSAFVLDRVLPAHGGEVAERIAALQGGSDLQTRLSDLELHLLSMSDEEFPQAVVGVDVGDMRPLEKNCAAAAVEREAWRRGLAAPEWTTDVRPLEHPWFAWRIRALRPHLMRIAPPAYKLRNVYLPSHEDTRQ